MKTIGFIDYFLDEWHAEKYPEWIEAATGGKMKVAYAYGKIDKPNGQTNAEWCERKGIELLSSISEVVAKSDYLIVLSPDHPEFHEELSRLPLASGKPTYIDKTFAPDRKTAELLFERAAAGGTPMYSTSALRYATEYEGLKGQRVETIASFGPGQLANYSIHQIEPIVMLMGNQVSRVMYTGTASMPSLLIGFADGRQATIHHADNASFSLTAVGEAGLQSVKVESNFFGELISGMVRFFDTGEAPVDAADTVAIVTVIEYALKAVETPFQWLELPVGKE